MDSRFSANFVSGFAIALDAQPEAYFSKGLLSDSGLLASYAWLDVKTLATVCLV